jgi:hypothetical protein
MSNCKSIDTSLSTMDKLSLTNGNQLGAVDSTKYHKMVVALQHLTLTSLDICFVVNKVCQSLHTPTPVH